MTPDATEARLRTALSAQSVLGDRRLYLCTPYRDDLEAFVDACIRGGVEVIQLREKAMEAKALVEAARRAGAICREAGVPFILNDRPDLALEAGADGVHVGQDDVSAKTARRILGPNAIVGLSTHAPEELRAAQAEPVDYISAGPVRQTPTKPGRAATGIEYVGEVASLESRPWFVTGGVAPDNLEELAAAGARRFVVVRYITEAVNPYVAARGMRGAIENLVPAIGAAS